MEIEQFAEIVRRYQAGVCAVAYGVTGDRALSEDIAQDTFLAAWRGASTLRDREPGGLDSLRDCCKFFPS